MHALRSLWTNPNPRRTKTDYIVIHHAAASYRPGTAVQSIYRYHASKWPDYHAAGYHCIIQEEPDGRFLPYLVNNPYQIGAGVKGYNHVSFHICLATNLTNQRPHERWLHAAQQAVLWAAHLFPTATLVGHRELTATTVCPGHAWSTWKPELLPFVQEGRRMPPAYIYPVSEAEQAGAVSDRLVAWLEQRGVDPHLALLYFTIGTEAHVDWIGAFAHALYASSWVTTAWSQPPYHNLAHIGITGKRSATRPVASSPYSAWMYRDTTRDYELGIGFASYDDAVRAHIGRLLAYAGAPMDHPLVTFALAVRPLADQYYGSAFTWLDLSGTWHPHYAYGASVLEVRLLLLRHA